MRSNAQTLQATALVHEAWIKLASGAQRTWNGPNHFYAAAAAARAMRRILINNARRKQAARPRAARVQANPVIRSLPNAPTTSQVLVYNPVSIGAQPVPTSSLPLDGVWRPSDGKPLVWTASPPTSPPRRAGSGWTPPTPSYSSASEQT